MWNKLYIIIDKKSIKPMLVWKFSGKDLIWMVIAFTLGFFPCKFLANDLVAIIIGSGLFAITGFLLVEMPDHLSILQHLKMWYDYMYNEPKEYFYIPVSEVKKDTKIEKSESKEWIEYQSMVRENRGY